MARDLQTLIPEYEVWLRERNYVMAGTAMVVKNAVGYGPVSLQRRANSPYGLAPGSSVKSQSGSEVSFFDLSPRAAHSFGEIRRTVSYPAGAILFMEGDEAQGVYIVCPGRVKLLTTNSEGKTLIFKIAKPGDILGLHATLSGAAHEITAETLQPAQLAYVSREDFLKFIKENGDACLQVAQHLGRDCNSAYEVIRSIGLSSSVEEKLARFLLDWSGDGQPANLGVKVKLSLTHEEIAQLIGCSRESVSRSFSDFKRKGLVEVSGATLVLQNRGALESLAAM
jgi:CRP/FNR family transcriptional regulator, cyclic AMP receptor protein